MNTDSMPQVPALTADDIVAIRPGRCKSARGSGWYAQIGLKDGQVGLYAVVCAWTVPEADEDDPESFAVYPGTGRPAAWVGRQVFTTDPAKALATYLAYKTACAAKKSPTVGEVIGSVVRGES